MEMETSTLVCFAVREEAAPFRKFIGDSPGVRILITGMGRRNAERAIGTALETNAPQLVLTCGFAGGLKPGLATGTVLFSAPGNAALAERLTHAEIQPARFHHADRVAVTAAEKRALFQQTGADALEMESGFISDRCAAQKISCAIVRVILDRVEEDLPLDFNALMNEHQQMNYLRLAAAVVQSPGKISSLLKLQKQSRFAAERLAAALARVV